MKFSPIARSLTTPMHTDRQELSAMMRRLSVAGDGQRYTAQSISEGGS
jgi:hypothetical protein